MRRQAAWGKAWRHFLSGTRLGQSFSIDEYFLNLISQNYYLTNKIGFRLAGASPSESLPATLK
jgi:hypothetical protein